MCIPLFVVSLLLAQIAFASLGSSGYRFQRANEPSTSQFTSRHTLKFETRHELRNISSREPQKEKSSAIHGHEWSIGRNVVAIDATSFDAQKNHHHHRQSSINKKSFQLSIVVMASEDTKSRREVNMDSCLSMNIDVHGYSLCFMNDIFYFRIHS